MKNKYKEIEKHHEKKGNVITYVHWKGENVYEMYNIYNIYIFILYYYFSIDKQNII